MANSPEPQPGREDWIDFLYWLADDPEISTRTIVRCIERPWAFKDEYAEYLNRGGLARQH